LSPPPPKKKKTLNISPHRNSEIVFISPKQNDSKIYFANTS
jgi:hypothetical protein